MLRTIREKRENTIPAQDYPSEISPLEPKFVFHRKYGLVLYIAGILTIVTVGHYLLSESFHIAHNVLQRLYYIPIVWAAYRKGLRGGLLVAGIAGLLYLPHVLISWQSHPEYQINQLIEVVLFFLVGISVGYLFEQLLLSQRQLKSYEKMALFGNLSRTIIRSLKGPLRGIKGMLLALEPMECRDSALESCVKIIRDEVNRIETVRDDLISLVERKKIRLKNRNLNDLMFDFVSQIETSLSVQGVRVTRQTQNIKLPAYYSRAALLNVLHQLVGTIVNRGWRVRELKFYSGQSSSYVWLGATSNQIQLPVHFQGDIVTISSQYHHEYELISVVSVMDNHFGDVRFRWQDGRLVEFILVFPKKLKLPWYSKDKSIDGIVQKGGKPEERFRTSAKGK